MNIPPIEIDGRLIGPEHPPYLVAEISANHLGSLQQAKRLIELAQRSNADAVKLQTYTPDTITIKSEKEDFRIKSGPWSGETLYQLYKRAQTPFEWHETLFAHAKEVGITIFSSPFDESAVDLLEGLRTPAYKIASFELVHLPLIERVARTGKPIILSTGLAELSEIEDAVEAARAAGCHKIVLLHCASGYPVPHDEMNLLTIKDLEKRFRCTVGLSDHTVGMTVAIAGASIGAKLIEKHFIESRSQPSPDADFSMQPREFREMAENVRTAWESIGTIDYSVSKAEEASRIFRRSIYITQDVRAGERLDQTNIAIVRPGFGMAPRNWKRILGVRAKRDLCKEEPLRWEDLDLGSEQSDSS